MVAAKTEYGLSAASDNPYRSCHYKKVPGYPCDLAGAQAFLHNTSFFEAPSTIRLFVALPRRSSKNRLFHAITWLNLTNPFLRGLNPGIESKSECTSSLTCRIGPYAPRFWSMITKPMIRSNLTSLILCPQPRREFVCCSSMATHFTARPYTVNSSKPITTTPSISLPEPSMKVLQPFSATVVNFSKSETRKRGLKENMNG